MVLDAPGRRLRAAELPVPEPGDGELLIRVHACGVCRTDLHVIDGEVRASKLPVVLRPPDRRHRRGERRARRRAVARLDVRRVPLLPLAAARTCATARASPAADLDGGFAEYAVADARFCFPIPDGYPDLQAAPLLCAGLIGHRALRMAGDAERLGLYGFGAAAHIVCQVARHEGRRVFAFTRAGRRRGAGLRARARRRVGRRVRRRAAGGARRGDRLRARSARSSRSRCARSPRAARSSAPAST